MKKYSFIDLLSEGNASSSLVKKIVKFVKKSSYFDYDDNENDWVSFTTRENGDVGAERPGAKDIKEAKRLKKLIEKEFSVTVKIEAIDEWVNLTANFGKQSKQPQYWFVKHDIRPWTSSNMTGFIHKYHKNAKELIPDIKRFCEYSNSEAKKVIKDLEKKKIDNKSFQGKHAEINLGHCGWNRFEFTIVKMMPQF